MVTLLCISCSRFLLTFVNRESVPRASEVIGISLEYHGETISFVILIS